MSFGVFIVVIYISLDLNFIYIKSILFFFFRIYGAYIAYPYDGYKINKIYTPTSDNFTHYDDTVIHSKIINDIIFRFSDFKIPKTIIFMYITVIQNKTIKINLFHEIVAIRLKTRR